MLWSDSIYLLFNLKHALEKPIVKPRILDPIPFLSFSHYTEIGLTMYFAPVSFWYWNYVFLQALFSKLQQLATVAGDVLLGKEKIQKILLARLTETVVMWLSEEQEFWDVFEDESVPLKPLGLQQVFCCVFWEDANVGVFMCFFFFS